MYKTTETVAHFIYHSSWNEIPREAVEIAKLHILDTLGVLCAGTSESITLIIKKYIQSMGCKPESSLLTQDIKTSPQYAAFGNGMLAHVLDFDDYEWPSMAHPSATVLPAVLSVGERLHASGRECLEAYLAGMEVISRVGMGINPSHTDKGWHSTCVLGTLGSASASAKLLKLDVERTKTALGIAASMSSGLRGNFGTMTKPFHAGHAARNGVEAAILASMGFTARQNILEHKLGFCRIFTQDDEFDLHKITDGLGDPFSILSPGIGKKLFPSCAATHSVLDGVFHLIRKHNISAADVDSVECGIFYLYPDLLIYPRPKTGLEGKFSLEFCVALALTEGAVRLKDFSDAKVNDPPIQALIKRVNKFVTDEVGGRGTQYPGATVTINLKDGTSCFTKIEARKGSPFNPLTRDEVITKFVENASILFSGAKVDEMIETVLNLNDVNDIGDVIHILRHGAR